MKNPVVSIYIKDKGVMKAELYPEIAPNTVNNFISLINKGFYNGLIFHRIIPNFMLQGGDPAGNGTGGPGYTIKGEFQSNGFPNELKHTEGVLSMARTMFPNSAGSQFFVMTSKSPHLDGEYAGFGMIIEGLDIAMQLQLVPTNAMDKPLEDVVIEKMEVETFGQEYPEPEKN